MIAGGAALAAVDKERPSAAHLAWLLGLEVEGARLGYGGVVHGVLAVAELVVCGGEGAGVDNALLIGIHEADALAGVAVGVDVPFTCATDEVSRLLVVSVVLCGPALKGLAASGEATLRCF